MLQTQSILLTGHRGNVGRWLRRSLERSGYSVTGFDIRDGDDVRDAPGLVRAASGTSVTVHCAVLPYGSPESMEVMLGINAQGTENVLRAAEAAGHRRVIVFSSIQVFGLNYGESIPRSFPIRDSSPLLAVRPYGVSKIAAEDLCEAFTARTGIATICLRPPHVWVPGQAADYRRNWSRRPEQEWLPFWNFGAFIDVRDVVSAVTLALSAPVQGHHRVSICAPDIAATAPTRAMTEKLMPTVPWEPGWPRSGDAWTALVDTSPARSLLGWQPVHSWAVGSRESVLDRLGRRLRDPFSP